MSSFTTPPVATLELGSLHKGLATQAGKRNISYYHLLGVNFPYNFISLLLSPSFLLIYLFNSARSKPLSYLKLFHRSPGFILLLEVNYSTAATFTQYMRYNRLQLDYPAVI